MATRDEHDGSDDRGPAAPAPTPDAAGPSAQGPRLGADPHALARWLRRGGVDPDDEPWLHAEVARRMGERLPLFAARPSRVLQWWGPARGSGILQAAYPQAALSVVVPDEAAGVRRPSASRRPWWHRLAAPRVSTLVQRDVPASQASMLWANMVVHAVPDVPSLLGRWHAALAEEGTLMFSTVGPDTLRELRALYRRNGWGTHGSEPVDMHDLGDALMHAGFTDPVMDQERLTLHWASPEALVSELRTLGVNADRNRYAGLRTPRWQARLYEGLRSQAAAADGRIALSFEIVYGHAFKPRARSGRTATIALDALTSQLPSKRHR